MYALNLESVPSIMLARFCQLILYGILLLNLFNVRKGQLSINLPFFRKTFE